MLDGISIPVDAPIILNPEVSPLELELNNLGLQENHLNFLKNEKILAHLNRYVSPEIHASSINEALESAKIFMAHKEELYNEFIFQCDINHQQAPDFLNTSDKFASFISTLTIINDVGKTGPNLEDNIVKKIYLDLNSYTKEELSSPLFDVVKSKAGELSEADLQTLTDFGYDEKTELHPALTQMHLLSLQKILDVVPHDNPELQLIKKIALNHHNDQKFTPPGEEYTEEEINSVPIQSIQGLNVQYDKLDATIKRSTKGKRPLSRIEAITRAKNNFYFNHSKNIDSNHRPLHMLWLQYLENHVDTYIPNNNKRLPLAV